MAIPAISRISARVWPGSPVQTRLSTGIAEMSVELVSRRTLLEVAPMTEAKPGLYQNDLIYGNLE